MQYSINGVEIEAVPGQYIVLNNEDKPVLTLNKRNNLVKSMLFVKPDNSLAPILMP